MKSNQKSKREGQKEKLFSLMEKISAEAKARGLTKEKLGEIMEWDRETMSNLFGEK